MFFMGEEKLQTYLCNLGTPHFGGGKKPPLPLADTHIGILSKALVRKTSERLNTLNNKLDLTQVFKLSLLNRFKPYQASVQNFSQALLTKIPT